MSVAFQPVDGTARSSSIQNQSPYPRRELQVRQALPFFLLKSFYRYLRSNHEVSVQQYSMQLFLINEKEAFLKYLLSSNSIE